MDDAASPNSMVWAVRDDGVMLALTFVQEQDVIAWTRHLTRGWFESVCTIREGDDDRVYAVVRRQMADGSERRFVERMAVREQDDISDAFCVDAGLTLDSPLTITGYTQASPVVVTTSAAHGFSNGDLVDINGVYETDISETLGRALCTDVRGASR